MRVLSHIEKYGETPYTEFRYIMETADRVVKRHLDKMVAYRLITQKQGENRLYRGQISPTPVYNITWKGRLYLAKVRALWEFLDGGRTKTGTPTATS